MNIVSKDLNLLSVFVVLMEELNTSKAAKRLALSQPAVSHALARLRQDFGDPLFVRGARGVVPTQMARSLAPKVREIVKAAERMYEPEEKFDPKKLRGPFRIATTEFMEQSIGVRLIKVLMQAAPDLQVVFRPTTGQFPSEELESGELDLAIAGFFEDVPEGFRRQKVMSDRYRCVVRKGHPSVKSGKIDLKTFTQMTHVLTSPHGDLWGAVDRMLDLKQMSRSVQAGFSSFLAPGWVVESSDAVLTTPSRMASLFQKYLQVEVCDVPVEIPSFAVYQIWHMRSQEEAGHVWIRGLIERICAEES